MNGQLAIVLHAHLPFVRHPEYPQFYEEGWFYEAMVETYFPLLRMMDWLWLDGIDFRLTLGVTPPLSEMMADPLLSERFEDRLGRLEKAAARFQEQHETDEFAAAAAHAVEELASIREVLERHGSILAGLRTFEERGRLELMTCGATHGYLPLLATDEGRRAQVALACETHERHFGRRPRGIWLPECAYAPGLETVLAKEDLRWFTLEKHGVLHATPPPRSGTARPMLTPSGPVVIARDPECSSQVWSADTGYPGDPAYREFYKDLGYEAEEKDLFDLLTGGGGKHPIGLKYHRITGKVALNQKLPYEPEVAVRRAAEHAGNFLFNRQAQLRHLQGAIGEAPLVVAPFDAELFGHWWYEGPRFLEYFFRKVACDQDDIGVTTPSEFLGAEPELDVGAPAMSSWGDKGFYEVWLNQGNAWTWRDLHRAEERMVELANRFEDADGITRRALNQAGRSLLLAQASDWNFLITTDTAGEYPKARTEVLLSRFERLRQGILDGDSAEVEPGESVYDSDFIEFLSECEFRDTIFPKLDYRIWRSEHVAERGAGAAVFTATL